MNNANTDVKMHAIYHAAQSIQSNLLSQIQWLAHQHELELDPNIYAMMDDQKWLWLTVMRQHAMYNAMSPKQLTAPYSLRQICLQIAQNANTFHLADIMIDCSSKYLVAIDTQILKDSLWQCLEYLTRLHQGISPLILRVRSQPRTKTVNINLIYTGPLISLTALQRDGFEAETICVNRSLLHMYPDFWLHLPKWRFAAMEAEIKVRKLRDGQASLVITRLPLSHQEA